MDRENPPTPGPNKGRIVFFCRPGVWGLAPWPRIRIDGTPVGRPLAGSYFYRDIDPGRHDATISTDAGRNVVFEIAAGEIRYIEVSAGGGGLLRRLRLDETDAAEGRAALAELAYAEERRP